VPLKTGSTVYLVYVFYTHQVIYIKAVTLRQRTLNIHLYPTYKSGHMMHMKKPVFGDSLVLSLMPTLLEFLVVVIAW